MGIDIICDQCGAAFHKKPSRVRTHNFCSPQCYQEWQDGKAKPRAGGIIRHCEICGAEFVGYQSNIDRGWDRFCSRQCKAEWQSRQQRPKGQPRRVTVHCQSCGKPFLVKPHAKATRRFCSIECTAEWRKTLTDSDNYNYKGGKVDFVCGHCGKVFSAYLSAKTQSQTFCSQECYHSHNRSERCYQWRGGVSFLPYPSIWTRAFRNSIRERDAHRCAICGGPAKHVHHIDSDKTNCDRVNLITLCSHCHPKTQHNREYWEPILSALANVRESDG